MTKTLVILLYLCYPQKEREKQHSGSNSGLEIRPVTPLAQRTQVKQKTNDLSIALLNVSKIRGISGQINFKVVLHPVTA